MKTFHHASMIAKGPSFAIQNMHTYTHTLYTAMCSEFLHTSSFLLSTNGLAKLTIVSHSSQVTLLCDSYNKYCNNFMYNTQAI